MVVSIEQNIELGGLMPLSNITATSSSDSLTVTNAGVYELNYVVSPSISLAATVSVSARLNGTDIEQTKLSYALSATTTSVFSMTTLVELDAGDVIDLAASSELAGTLTIPEYGASLMLLQVS